jgi:hypothetical protein
MQASVSFDTLEFLEDLKRSGIPELQAEAITRATAKALNQFLDSKEIATKKDINELKELIHSNSYKIIGAVAIIQGMFISFYQFINHLFT